MVLNEMLPELRKVAACWPSPATLEAIERAESIRLVRYPEPLRDLLVRVNGFEIEQCQVLGVPAEFPTAVIKKFVHPCGDHLDGTDIPIPGFRYVPIAQDSFGNCYVLDTSRDWGSLSPVFFLNHEVEYEAEYVAASNLWSFLRFFIGFELEGYEPERFEAILDRDRLFGPAPQLWIDDRDYVFAQDPLLKEYNGEVALIWDD